MNAQSILYKSKDFTILPDKVIQGKYEAIAKSRTEMSTSYKSDYKDFISNKINPAQLPGERTEKWIEWKLSKDISNYPSYNSPDVLVDALYNHALEEMLLNIRPDGAFMAGAKWTGVWTRDISYSIFLSLAMVNPDASKTSLMAKVKNDRIIQDTGTGGAWPVSSDRLVWAIAAWEVYLSTGDNNWLKTSYKIIKNSADDDLNTVYDKSTGLFRGESSFLDWREQTYPQWMDPKDIYSSKNLGTNAVHYQAFKILAGMAKILREPSKPYLEVAQRIKDGMNKYLWMNNKGYYGQYLYGRNYFSLSPKSEALGEALSVLFNIPTMNNAKQVIEKTPVTNYGITCIYPQIPNIPPYHNNAIWPFVESYWAWASAKEGNAKSVEYALASVYRAASLFMTNKENMVAGTGDYLGTEINSDRQLWSVAGNLALVYRVIFGISLSPNSLKLHPFIPKEYNGERTLANFKYRNSILSITINGYGDKIKSMSIDGKKITGNKIPAILKGKHSILIVMNNKIGSNSSINLVEDRFSPETPAVKQKNDTLSWEPIKTARQLAGKDTVEYIVYRNGKEISRTKNIEFKIAGDKVYSDYQVMAVDKNGMQSFLSEPLPASWRANDERIIVQAEDGNISEQKKYPGFTGTGYVVLDKNLFPNQELNLNVKIPSDGVYAIDFRYANGNGPINTDNKCAIRTLKIDNITAAPIVLPQRGINEWSNWGYSNSVLVKLNKGTHTFKILFTPSDNNMNVETNTALLDFIRLTKIN
ncbi:MAG: alpha-L-rhamnosidase-related protein [Ignavibacteriaceae bacterium]